MNWRGAARELRHHARVQHDREAGVRNQKQDRENPPDCDDMTSPREHVDNLYNRRANVKLTILIDYCTKSVP